MGSFDLLCSVWDLFLVVVLGSFTCGMWTPWLQHVGSSFPTRLEPGPPAWGIQSLSNCGTTRGSSHISIIRTLASSFPLAANSSWFSTLATDCCGTNGMRPCVLEVAAQRAAALCRSPAPRRCEEEAGTSWRMGRKSNFGRCVPSDIVKFFCGKINLALWEFGDSSA